MIGEFFKKASEEGMKLPFAYDSSTKKPSVTLLFLYVTTVVALFSLFLLIYKDILLGCITSCIYSIIWAVLYLMRRLQKAKFDLDDKAIELEGEDDAKDP